MKKLLLFALIFTGIYSQAQFSESFEASTAIPTGWTVINGGDANTWVGSDLSTSTGLQAENGTKMFTIMYTTPTAHDDYFITPSVSVTAGVSDQLTFWARSRDAAYPETISIKISTTTATAAAFTTTLSPVVAPASGVNFYKYTYNLSAYIGQTIYIAFYSSTADQFYFDLDYVVVGSPQSCIEPSALSFSNITSTSANLSWSASSSLPSNGYEIYYSTSGIAPTSSTTPNMSVGAGVTNTTLSGLTAATKYYVYVRSNCGGSKSVWGPLGVVITPSVIPYSNNFDASTTLAGNGWAGSWTVGTATANSQSAPNYLFNNSSTTAANNIWVYSGALIFTGGQAYDLSFYAKTSTSGADAHTLNINFGTDQTSASQTNVIKTSQSVPYNATYTKYTYTFTPSTSGTYYIGIQDATPIVATASSMRFDTFGIVKGATLATIEGNKSKFNVYPNPVKDVLNVSSIDKKLTSTEIYSMDGRLVKTINLSSADSKIIMTDLKPGVYTVKVKDVSGNIQSFKVIKE